MHSFGLKLDMTFSLSLKHSIFGDDATKFSVHLTGLILAGYECGQRGGHGGLKANNAVICRLFRYCHLFVGYLSLIVVYLTVLSFIWRLAIVYLTVIWRLFDDYLIVTCRLSSVIAIYLTVVVIYYDYLSVICRLSVGYLLFIAGYLTIIGIYLTVIVG